MSHRWYNATVYLSFILWKEDITLMYVIILKPSTWAESVDKHRVDLYMASMVTVWWVPSSRELRLSNYSIISVDLAWPFFVLMSILMVIRDSQAYSVHYVNSPRDLAKSAWYPQAYCGFCSDLSPHQQPRIDHYLYEVKQLPSMSLPTWLKRWCTVADTASNVGCLNLQPATNGSVSDIHSQV